MITLYMVMLKDVSKPENRMIFTISEKVSECESYLNNLMLLDNKEHFISWCNIHECPVNDLSWKKYLKLDIVDKNKYVIRKVKYSKNDIASILRMFNHCIPMGGFETENEIKLFLNNLPQDKFEELSKIINQE